MRLMWNICIFSYSNYSMPSKTINDNGIGSLEQLFLIPVSLWIISMRTKLLLNCYVILNGVYSVIFLKDNKNNKEKNNTIHYFYGICMWWIINYNSVINLTDQLWARKQIMRDWLAERTSWGWNISNEGRS